MAPRKHWEFWMVYGQGRAGPAREHLSLRSAQEEAKRLSREHRGITFFVLEAKRGYLVADPPVEEVEIDPDEIPF